MAAEALIQQMEAEMRAMRAAPRGSESPQLGQDVSVLYRLDGKPTTRPSITAREILASQEQSPRDPEDTLYPSAEAAAAARGDSAELENVEVSEPAAEAPVETKKKRRRRRTRAQPAAESLEPEAG